MPKKELTFGGALQKKVEQYNKRVQKNQELFRSLGGDVNKPIDLMTLIKKDKK